MAGIETDPLSHIESIRRLLDGYAEGFAFIKELIQNADDAGSSELVLRWHEGLAGRAEHPLLQGPSLVVLNNGAFEKHNRDGLMRMGLGSKASDAERIGRFGLGMKSVFHVCEGFFFLGSRDESDLKEFFTPWHMTYHREWDLGKDDEDWSILRDELSGLADKSWEQWFAVWIPLRRESHCQVIDPIRQGAEAFPGDHAGQCPGSLKQPFFDTAPRLSETLLFLRKIRSVSFFDGLDLRAMTHDRTHGTVAPGNRYYRRDIVDRPEIASIWQSKPTWPKVFDVGTRLTTEQVPDKAQWKASVAVSVNRDNESSGKLRLFWCVYLPVGNRPVEDIFIEGLEADLHVFLHGYFFINETRTAILGADDGFAEADEGTERGIRIGWNKELANSEHGLLPLVVPALEKCFQDERFEDAQIRPIIKALAGSEWFGIHRGGLGETRFGRYFFGGKWAWRSLPAGTPVRIMPIFGVQEGKVEQMLAVLFSAPIAFTVKLDPTPALSRLPHEPSWTTKELDEFSVILCELQRPFDLQERDYLRKLFTRPGFPSLNTQQWKSLSIYDVRSIRGNKSLVLSANEIDIRLREGQLFGETEPMIERSLARACRSIEVLFLKETPPPGVFPPDLDAVYAARLAFEEQTLSIASDRLDLAKLLVENVASHLAQQIRYVIHADWGHRMDSATPLFFQGGEWQGPITPFLTQIESEWSLIDPIFEADLTEHQQKRLNLQACSAEAFRKLCADASQADRLATVELNAFHDFLLIHLIDGPRDDEFLRGLPIHSDGGASYRSITSDIWLAPAINPVVDHHDEWDLLREKARVVSRRKDPIVALRQDQLFVGQILDKDGIIQLATGQPDASVYAGLILDCLSHGTPAKDARNSLLRTSWLPLGQKGACKPGQIAWIKDADSELAALVRRFDTDRQFFIRSEVVVDWETERNKRAWNTLVNPMNPLLPAKDDLVTLLDQAVGAAPILHFGIPFLDDMSLDAWLSAIEGMELDISTGVALVKRIWTASNLETTASERIQEERKWMFKVAQVFFRTWEENTASRYDTALEALRNRHVEAGATQRAHIENTFDRYLACARDAGRWAPRYIEDPDFTLLNQEGKWMPIGQLAAPVLGISRASLVTEHTAKLLGFFEQPVVLPVDDGEAGEAVKDDELTEFLQTYAQNFGETVSRRQWALFLALLGPNVRDLADEWSDGRIEAFRDELVGPLRSKSRTRLVQCSYQCEVVLGESATLVAVNGKLFDAPRETSSGSLLIPQVGLRGQENRHFVFADTTRIPYRVSFKLRDVSTLSTLTPSERRGYLERTIRILQKEVLHVPSAKLDEVGAMLDKIQKLDQKSLGIAQQEILGSCRIHLSQLAFRAAMGSRLAEALRQLDDADRLEAQAREDCESEMGDWKAVEREARTCKDHGLRGLRQVLNGDRVVQEQLAFSMRTRIQQEQYRPDSVPFELFQNADDALSELPPDANVPHIFVTEFRPDVAYFAHWGRPINHPAGADEATARPFTRDLVKMLILHGSDKQASAETALVTGKFGLGFKSVFLISKQPEVLSKDLGFEVAGAIWPKRLNDESRKELGDWLEQTMPTEKSGTVVKLPIDPEIPSVFEIRFRALAPYLPVFARKIREIRILGPKGHSHRWNPETVDMGDNWCLQRGEIQLDVHDDQFLHFQQGDVSWLFGLDSKGLKRLKGLPCLWITAPTLESDDLGFAINGPFDPHPGRTYLSSSVAGREKNQALFSKASEGLAEFLEWCVSRGEHVGLSIYGHANLDLDTFWRSVWNLFNQSGAPGDEESAKAQILKSLWSSDSGYGRFIKSNSVIPNGFPGKLHTLTNADAVHCQTSGFMDAELGVKFLTDVLDWVEIVNAEPSLRITRREIVSAKVASVLRGKLQADNQFTAVSVTFLILRLAGLRMQIPPTLCGKLGGHLSAAILFPDNPQTASYEWPSEERGSLTEFLSKLRFLNLEGDWVGPQNLLIKTAGGEEGLRANFAPPDRCLNPEYWAQAGALDFFKLCRRQMQLLDEDITSWLRQSILGSDPIRRLSALRFLASTDAAVADSARGLGDEERRVLHESPEYGNLTHGEQDCVNIGFKQADLRQLHEEVRRRSANFSGLQWATEENTFSAAISLQIDVEALLRTWDPDKALHHFTVSGPLGALVVPGGDTEQIAAHLRDPRSFEGKAAWFRLLCLGCSLSIPLGTCPSRRVIHLWQQLGNEFWDATIPNSLGQPESETFRQHLDTTFEAVIHRLFKDENAAGEDAEFWRRVFYDFRKMHHFVFRNDLPEVIFEVAAYSEADGHALINFFRSGLLPDALRDPGTPRFRGVIGQSMTSPLLFVMRELRRIGVLDDARFDPACYYMNSPARRVARQLGWIETDASAKFDFAALVNLSENIHERMEAEVPDLLGYFDLPLQWFASENPL